jgi:DNA-binding MarR family transcriptional regulator
MANARGSGHEFLEPGEYEAWNAMLGVTQAVLRELDAALRADDGLSVTEFDVLITLWNAPRHRLGMTELASRVLLSPSGLTHLVTRMERDGLVAREGDPADGRKFHTVLTSAGEARLRAARRTHNTVLRSVLLGHLGPKDRRALADIGRRLSAATEAAAGPQPTDAYAPKTRRTGP